MNPDEGVRSLLGRCTFPESGKPVVCAVSGGADSLALLVLATAAGCEVTAVHVDHGLRPGSGEEAERVEQAARRLGASFRALNAMVGLGPNLEARARTARRAVLPKGAATGHTMDDQAETVLLRLLRGTGPDGLAAMRPGPEHPLLALRRKEALGVTLGAGLEPLEDPSNVDPSIQRNRVRHELLPLCSELAGRDVTPLLARLALLAGEDADWLGAKAADLDPTDAAEIAAAPAPIARRALRGWLRGDGPYPPDLAAVERVLAVARGGARDRGRSDHAGTQDCRTSSGRAACRPCWWRDELSAGKWRDDPLIGPVVVSEADLRRKVGELGAQIAADYADRPPLLVGVLKGAFVFMSDLAREIRLPVEVDVMAVASYGTGTSTSGVVRIVKDLDTDLTGRHVIIVEDIVDSGLTLSYLRRNLLARQPASLEVCALLVKEGRQRTDLDLRYVGFRIPPDFVVGYGLDVAERFRNLRDLHVYTGEVTDG